MFYDRDSMIEMFDIAMEKRHIEGSRWIPVLITCNVEFTNRSKSDSIARILNQWTDLVKNQVNDRDAAYYVNEGNIFALVHENNYHVFVRHVTEAATIVLLGSATFRSIIRPLEIGEAQMILCL
jgi:hypothetical protein